MDDVQSIVEDQMKEQIGTSIRDETISEQITKNNSKKLKKTNNDPNLEKMNVNPAKVNLSDMFHFIEGKEVGVLIIAIIASSVQGIVCSVYFYFNGEMNDILSPTVPKDKRVD